MVRVRSHRAAPAGLALAAALALGACGDTRQVLGLDKTVPDEFKIVSRAPLSLPPDYALRPPQPGVARPQEPALQQRAQAAIIGASATRSAAPAASNGEAALLAHVGAERANPEIRTVLEREHTAIAAADVTFVDTLMFWRKPEDRSPVVDPAREAQRLRENAALGRPTTDGDTPTITRRKRAPLEGIF